MKLALVRVVSLVALFIAFSAWNELRPPDPSRESLSERGSVGATPAPDSKPAE